MGARFIATILLFLIPLQLSAQFETWEPVASIKAGNLSNLHISGEHLVALNNNTRDLITYDFNSQIWKNHPIAHDHNQMTSIHVVSDSVIITAEPYGPILTSKQTYNVSLMEFSIFDLSENNWIYITDLSEAQRDGFAGALDVVPIAVDSFLIAGTYGVKSFSTKEQFTWERGESILEDHSFNGMLRENSEKIILHDSSTVYRYNQSDFVLEDTLFSSENHAILDAEIYDNYLIIKTGEYLNEPVFRRYHNFYKVHLENGESELLDQKELRNIKVSDSTLYAWTDSELFTYNPDENTYESLNVELSGTITDVAASENQLVVSTRSGVFLYENNSVSPAEISHPYLDIKKFSVDEDDNMYLTHRIFSESILAFSHYNSEQTLFKTLFDSLGSAEMLSGPVEDEITLFDQDSVPFTYSFEDQSTEIVIDQPVNKLFFVGDSIGFATNDTATFVQRETDSEWVSPDNYPRITSLAEVDFTLFANNFTLRSDDFGRNWTEFELDIPDQENVRFISDGTGEDYIITSEGNTHFVIYSIEADGSTEVQTNVSGYSIDYLIYGDHLLVLNYSDPVLWDDSRDVLYKNMSSDEHLIEIFSNRHGFYTMADHSKDYMYLAVARQGIFRSDLPEDTAVDELSDPKNRPYSISVSPAYPNPFNPETTIPFELTEASGVSIGVYSITGKLVQTLSSKSYSSGNHNIRFNASNLASGTYFVRFSIRTKSGKQVSKMQSVTLIK
jgi:hypothetical protein